MKIDYGGDEREGGGSHHRLVELILLLLLSPVSCHGRSGVNSVALVH